MLLSIDVAVLVKSLLMEVAAFSPACAIPPNEVCACVFSFSSDCPDLLFVSAILLSMDSKKSSMPFLILSNSPVFFSSFFGLNISPIAFSNADAAPNKSPLNNASCALISANMVVKILDESPVIALSAFATVSGIKRIAPSNSVAPTTAAANGLMKASAAKAKPSAATDLITSPIAALMPVI